jgi:hypothetical protein
MIGAALRVATRAPTAASARAGRRSASNGRRSRPGETEGLAGPEGLTATRPRGASATGVRRSNDRAGAARPTGAADGRRSRGATPVESRTGVALRRGRAAGTAVAAGLAPRPRGDCLEGATRGCRIVSASVLGLAGRRGAGDAAAGTAARAAARGAGAATGSTGRRSSAGGADGSRKALATAGEGGSEGGGPTAAAPAGRAATTTAGGSAAAPGSAGGGKGSGGSAGRSASGST